MKDEEPVVFDDENPEWTDEDFARARPANEVVPPHVLAALMNPRMVAVPADRERISIVLDRDVLARFRAAGPDWEKRINAALRRADF